MTSKLDNLYQSVGTNPSKEPALAIGGSVTTVAGALSLLAFFAPDLLSEKTIVIILVASAFLLPMITAFATRHFVWSPASVEEVVNEAVNRAEETLRELQNRKRKVDPEVPPSIGPI